MPRKVMSIYTNYPLPEESNALTHLESFCEEWGNISRADATQRIIIAWAKARGGDLAALAAMGITLSVVGSAATTTEKTTEAPIVPTAENKPVARRTNGNAKSVELDL